MNAVTFDTLKAARRLRDEFGFDERQATGIVETFADGMGVSLDRVATKDDLAAQDRRAAGEFAAVRAETAQEFAAFRAEVAQEFAAVRAEMAQESAAVRAEFAAVRAEIAAVRSEAKADAAALRAGLAAMEQRMTIKLGGMIAAAAGFLVLVDKLL